MPPQLPRNWVLSARGGGRGVMGIARTVAGNTGARKPADDDDQLSAFRRSNDELTFIDFLIGKAGECSQCSFWGGCRVRNGRAASPAHAQALALPV
jgi:hypothetical protein